MRGYTGSLIIIPTRNRAELAAAAIRSVLQQDDADVRVLVSDNSTSQDEVACLSAFCEKVGDTRLHYTRPPEPLPMASHWNWAAQQGLELSDASHISFLTDRMIFKPGALAQLRGAASQYPDRIISYMHDRVADNQRPVHLDQHVWTGKLFAVRSSRLLQLSSQSVLHEMLPRMLNCLVPRRVLTALKARYGKLFDSYGPDFNFCYRSLEMEDSIVFYDAAFLLHYALDRSYGASASRGEVNRATAELVSTLKLTNGYFAAPIPQILTARNAIAHEYCCVRDETRSHKFPALSQQKYLQATAQELGEVVDPDVRSQMEELLRRHGWKEPGLAAKTMSMAQKIRSPRRVADKLTREVKTLALRITNGTNLRPPEFATRELALDYALRFPRPRVESQPELEQLFELECLPLRDKL